MKTKLTHIAILFAVVMAALFGCDRDIPSNRKTPPSDVRLAFFEDTPPAPVVDVSGPVLACILNDVSGSMSYYGARPMVVGDVLPLIDAMSAVGGELAVGSIEARPSEPFMRLRLLPPESHEPPEATNVFTRNKLMRAWERDAPERQAREERRREQNRVRIEAFVGQLQRFLERPADAQATDIWNSLRRCEVFLEESDLYWTRVADAPPERFALLVSDGRQTVQTSRFRPISSSIRVLIVSGSRDVGNFDQLRPAPLWFESPAAAVLYIASTVGGR